MLIRKERILFVHVPKAAGQSIEHFFLDRAGLAWQRRGAFLMGPNDDPSLGPPRLAHLLARDYVARGHMGQAEFDACFKFAFVRHPVSRALSMYRYNRAFYRQSFHDYVSEFLPARIAGPDNWFHRPQVDFLCNERGEFLVDFIGRFEALERDFAEVAARLSIAFDHLPHVNKTLSNDHGAARLGPLGRIRMALRERRRAKRRRQRLGHDGFRVPSLDEVLADAEVMKRLTDLYADDFIRLGYTADRVTVEPPLAFDDPRAVR